MSGMSSLVFDVSMLSRVANLQLDRASRTPYGRLAIFKIGCSACGKSPLR